MDYVAVLYMLVAIIGCYLGAIAIKFEPEKKLTIFQSILFEYKSIFSKESKAKLNLTRVLALLLLIVLSLIPYLSYWIIILIVLVILVFTLARKNFMDFLKMVLRYALEIPKLFFLYLFFGVPISIYPVLTIISLGSLFYLIIPRGIFLQEILIFLINSFVLYLDWRLNLIIILSIRLIGLIFFVLPLRIIEYYEDRFRKFPRQRLVFSSLMNVIKKGTKELLTERIKNILKLKFSRIYFFGSGRDSLFFMLKAIKKHLESGNGVHKQYDILVPAFNFSLIPAVVKKAGFNPVFVDVDKRSFNIDPNEIKKKITKDTKVLLIAHLLGNPCDMESILKIVKEHKLILIEDCAHCMDSEYKGKVCGSFGDVSMFSLHRTKPLHGLYGGLAVVNNPKIEIQEDIYRGRVNYFKEIKLLMVNNIESLLLNGPIFNFFFWYVLNFFNQVGMNLLDKLSEDSKTYQPGEFVKQIGRININVLVDNLTKLEVRSNSRLTKADAYSELLDGLSLQKKLRFAKYAPMLFPVLVDNISKFRKFMWQNNIDTKTKYMLNISNDTECVAEKLEHSIVYLPFYYALRPKDVKYISSRVNAYFLSKL